MIVEKTEYDGSYVCDEEALYDHSSETAKECSDDTIEYEKEYFGEVMEESVEEEDVAVWEDSEDKWQSRQDYRKTASWLGGSSRKHVEIRKKKLRFKYERILFLCKCNIKIAKPCGEYFVLVDTYNIIYVLKSFKLHKAFKIEKFGVADLVFVNGTMLLASSRQSGFKEVDFDGTVRCIRKKVAENIRKMAVSGEFVYVVGDKLALLSGVYDVVEVFDVKVKDIAISGGWVYALDFVGQIFILTPGLQVLKKVSFDDRFDFESIYFVGGAVVVGTGFGVKIFDKNVEFMELAVNVRDKVTGCVECEGHIVVGAPHDNSIKVITPEMVCFDKFPFNSIHIPPVRTMGHDGKSIIICSGRAVNTLRIWSE